MKMQHKTVRRDRQSSQYWMIIRGGLLRNLRQLAIYEQRTGLVFIRERLII